ncbi:MAG: putative toxin-antitoxin system toxin component, PIN family [Chloroflexota bacterium]
MTVDTNVLFAALYNPKGASAFIFDLFIREEIWFALSVPIFMEYQDVLKRKEILEKIGLEAHDVDAILRFIADQASLFDIAYLWRPNLRDEADNMFVECAIRSQSQFLITSNVRDFKLNNELFFDDLEIVTPKEFVLSWRVNHE